MQPRVEMEMGMDAYIPTCILVLASCMQHMAAISYKDNAPIIVKRERSCWNSQHLYVLQ